MDDFYVCLRSHSIVRPLIHPWLKTPFLHVQDRWWCTSKLQSTNCCRCGWWNLLTISTIASLKDIHKTSQYHHHHDHSHLCRYHQQQHSAPNHQETLRFHGRSRQHQFVSVLWRKCTQQAHQVQSLSRWTVTTLPRTHSICRACFLFCIFHFWSTRRHCLSATFVNNELRSKNSE